MHSNNLCTYLQAHELLYLAISAKGLPANCCSIFCNNLVFLISKLPQSVFSPPAARSSESWLRIVVFPEPVGPVMTVSSPRLRPLMIFVNRGNDCRTVPLYSSGFCKRNIVPSAENTTASENDDQGRRHFEASKTGHVNTRTALRSKQNWSHKHKDACFRRDAPNYPKVFTRGIPY